MDQLEILDLALNILYCPVCGSSFDRSRVHIAGQVDEKYVIQTSCKSGHLPIQATLLVAFEQKGAQVQFVSFDDALDIKNTLNKHTGSLRALVSH